MSAILHIKKRKDFLRAQKSGKNVATSGLVLQAIETACEDNSVIRVGFTATKKLGNAVRRNRIKRRLRAAAREVMPKSAIAGHDYVIIGRYTAANRDFQSLIKDLKYALHNTGTFKK